MYLVPEAKAAAAPPARLQESTFACASHIMQHENQAAAAALSQHVSRVITLETHSNIILLCAAQIKSN